MNDTREIKSGDGEKCILSKDETGRPEIHIKKFWLTIAAVLGMAVCVVLSVLILNGTQPLVDTPHSLAEKSEDKSTESSGASTTYQLLHYQQGAPYAIYYECSKDDKPAYGLLDAEMSIMVPALYDFISPINPRLFVVTKDEKIGMINEKGECVVSIQYDELDYRTTLNNSYDEKNRLSGLITRLGSKWFVMDSQGSVLGKGHWDRLFFTEEGLIYAVDGSSEYLLTLSGDIERKIDSTPSVLEETRTGRLVITKLVRDNQEFYGVQDDTGAVILPNIFTDMQLLSAHRILAVQGSDMDASDGKAFLYNEKGETVSPEYTQIYFWSSGGQVSKNGIAYLSGTKDVYFLIDQDGSRIDDNNYEYLEFLDLETLNGIIDGVEHRLHIDGELLT